MTNNEQCGCGCGHNHEHEHNHENCGCGCGCNHEQHEKKPINPEEITENQKAFLHELEQRHFLPVARFTLKDSREKDFNVTALAPVFLRSTTDSMELVKEAGAFLKGLEDMGLITLDYDIPLNGYEYEEYKNSEIYKYFCATVAEGATKPNFLGDTPVLELGSMAICE